MQKGKSVFFVICLLFPIPNSNEHSGVPRFKEVIDISKNPATPSTQIFLADPYANSKELALKVAREITATYLKDFVLSSDVLLDENNASTNVDTDVAMVELFTCICVPSPRADWSKFCARVVLNKELLLQKGLTVIHVRRAMRHYANEKLRIITSEVHDDEWVCRVRIKKISHAMRLDKVKDIPADELLQLERITTSDVIDSMVKKLRVSGLEKIPGAYVSQKKGKYIIETDGLCLKETLCSGEMVHFEKCISNSIQEVYATLGIEAARLLIYREIYDVLTDSGDYISCRHVELLANKMCFIGSPVPVTRHGMRKASASVLECASFERTVETFVDAAIYGSSDNPANSVTGAIILGRLPNVGSGFSKLICEPVSPDPVFIGRRKPTAKTHHASRAYLAWNWRDDPLPDPVCTPPGTPPVLWTMRMPSPINLRVWSMTDFKDPCYYS